MADRYFSSRAIPFSEGVGPTEFTLDGEGAHHLIRVMRVKPGERLVLFDGTGAEFDAAVTEVGKKSLALEILARRTENRELPVPLWLAVALPKGERQRWLVEKAVELGASHFVPLLAERSVVKAGEAAGERLERMVVEAAKQCGRNTLMKILPARTSRELFRGADGSSAEEDGMPRDAVRILAHPGGAAIKTLCAECRLTQKPLLAAVGPEGGFSDAEIHDARQAGWQAVSLGRTILRTETAAIKIAAVFSAEVENN